MELQINNFYSLNVINGIEQKDFRVHQLLSIINLINEMIFYKMLLVIKLNFGGMF